MNDYGYEQQRGLTVARWVGWVEGVTREKNWDNYNRLNHKKTHRQYQTR